jgi:2-methylcitrate dehydratase PrpD
MAAVCAAGRPAPASTIAADHAAALHPAAEATALLDGRRVGAVGAAFANGVLANVLDYDDGHRLTKGHPGAIVIPAALAVAQLVDASEPEFVVAVAIGYEVAIRAGIALHGRDPAYHASGAWGAIGAAAAAARLLGLDAAQTISALGLAEYHAPIAPIMRSCADPQMTKDACSWGASVGVTSALLAARGFSSVRAEFLDGKLGDLGRRWRLEELYIKAYPCCRWSQGAIAAALGAGDGRSLAAAEIGTVRIRTFAAADGLAKVIPETTEEAQYSLLWPVACALVHGRFGVPEVLGPFSDPDVTAVFERITVDVDPDLTAAFPARRLTEVVINLADGTRRQAGPLEAPGEPDDPGLPALVAAKVHALMTSPSPRSRRAEFASGGLRDCDAPQLFTLLASTPGADADG